MKNQIVILAAGKGTRMNSRRVPKVLIMLKQKPLILYLLHELEKMTMLAKPIVVIGYMAARVRGVLGDRYVFAYQEEQLGTAHALLAARPKIKAENVLVLYGDMPFLKAESLGELVKMHLRGGAKISMLTAEVQNFRGKFEALEHYGRIIRDATHNLIAIVEYKDAAPAQKKLTEVNPGVYMFNTAWLWKNLKKIEDKNAQREYYLTDVVALAVSQGEKINSLLVSAEQVVGINSPRDLLLAEKLLKIGN